MKEARGDGGARCFALIWRHVPVSHSLARRGDGRSRAREGGAVDAGLGGGPGRAHGRGAAHVGGAASLRDRFLPQFLRASDPGPVADAFRAGRSAHQAPGPLHPTLRPRRCHHAHVVHGHLYGAAGRRGGSGLYLAAIRNPRRGAVPGRGGARQASRRDAVRVRRGAHYSQAGQRRPRSGCGASFALGGDAGRSQPVGEGAVAHRAGAGHRHLYGDLHGAADLHPGPVGVADADARAAGGAGRAGGAGHVGQLRHDSRRGGGRCVGCHAL